MVGHHTAEVTLCDGGVGGEVNLDLSSSDEFDSKEAVTFTIAFQGVTKLPT